MNFETVAGDLLSLIGYKLESIRPGASIVIDTVNINQGRVFVITSSGKRRSRPINEIKTIWQKLHEQPAVHVDEVLHGSGTSRNQPETIMANLPYIEWLIINNKKHIVYTGKNTHPLGTKKQMDEISAEKIREKMRGEAFDDLSVAIITDNIHQASHIYENMTGIMPIIISTEVYLFRKMHYSVLLISSSIVSNVIPCGTYSVIAKPVDFDIKPLITINEITFGCKCIHGVYLLIRL